MNWKTTVMGVLTILGSVCTGAILILKGDTGSGATAILTGLSAGIGLIVAKDAKE